MSCNIDVYVFLCQGGNGGDTQILGVSHRGIKMLRMVRASGINPKHLKLLRSYRYHKGLIIHKLKKTSGLCFSIVFVCLFVFTFGILLFLCHRCSYAEMLSVEQKGAETVLISLKSEELQLHSPQAPQITHMVRLFLIELTKVLIPHPPSYKYCMILNHNVLMQRHFIMRHLETFLAILCSVTVMMHAMGKNSVKDQAHVHVLVCVCVCVRERNIEWCSWCHF